MAEFLFEIGLEEIPARMIAGAEAELARRVAAMLERERLTASGVATKSFSTPRRLAVWIGGVAVRQEDVAEELLGPSAKIGYRDGVATPAAVAFAKKAGVTLEDLKTVTTPKGEYLQAMSVKPGRSAVEVIAAELPKELAAIYWAKTMYWRTGKPERFVRPVRWILALLGGEVVPVEFAGYAAGRETFGHRVLHGAAPVVVNAPSEYAAALRAAWVEPEVEARRHTIRKALDGVCRTLPDTRWREDHALVDKLTHLTEWPTVIAGRFEPEYLALPEEVLVTVMRDHQNYFAVEDKQGRLAPHFLAVLNTQADVAGEAVIRHGNERVLRARFNDARFFWEFDQRVPLVERVALLEKVTFQKDLGSYAAKTERVRKLALSLGRSVSERGVTVDFAALEQAVLLAKTDLTCELVKEFTELQGIVGGRYALAQGCSKATADAIYDQYLPKSMEDTVPRTVEGALLAIADKADTIAGMFSLGLEPTGSKDPFALRRAANGLVKIMAEAKPLPIKMMDWIAAATTDQGVRAKLFTFLAERLDFYLREGRGGSYDVVKAVLAADAEDPRDAVLRMEAIGAMRGSGDFEAIAAALKRMKNILRQAEAQSPISGFGFDPALFRQPEESALAKVSEELSQAIAPLSVRNEYRTILELTATLRKPVDAFFEAVMVMAPEAEIRANRLSLLASVEARFSWMADFSEIVTSG